MKRIFIDRDKCQACMTCMIVCSGVQPRDIVGDGDEAIWFLYGIESRNYITYANGYSTPIICRHCDDPECVATCMSGALQKNRKTGHVYYDKKRCGKCFMCIMCCPYGVTKPEFESKSEVIRCNFCNGIAETPRCAASCPMEAIAVKDVEQ